MRKFKFVGDEMDSKGYRHSDGKCPEIGKIYNEDDVFCDYTVLEWSQDVSFDIKNEWEEVFEKTEKPIDKVTVELLDVALRICNIPINKSWLDELIDVIELLEEKGGSSTIEDFEDLKAQWKK